MAPLIKEKFVGNVERNYSGPIQGTSPAIAGGIEEYHKNLVMLATFRTKIKTLE